MALTDVTGWYISADDAAQLGITSADDSDLINTLAGKEFDMSRFDLRTIQMQESDDRNTTVEFNSTTEGVILSDGAPVTPVSEAAITDRSTLIVQGEEAFGSLRVWQLSEDPSGNDSLFITMSTRDGLALNYRDDVSHIAIGDAVEIDEPDFGYRPLDTERYDDAIMEDEVELIDTWMWDITDQVSGFTTDTNEDENQFAQSPETSNFDLSVANYIGKRSNGDANPNGTIQWSNLRAAPATDQTGMKYYPFMTSISLIMKVRQRRTPILVTGSCLPIVLVKPRFVR